MGEPEGSASASVPVRSDSESARFGRPVSRLVVESGDTFDFERLAGSLEAGDADVVILRYPNSEADVFARLMRLRTHQPMFADCLMYWDCSTSLAGSPLGISEEVEVGLVPTSDIGTLVRPVFSQYRSHYAANPLFDPADVLEGYVEWVTALVADGHAACLVLFDQAGHRAGFAIVDFGSSVPDIRLGGIDPEFRGRGLYGDLIAASMNLASARGFELITISTQAHNVAVMSTWARLGWTPRKAVTTVHLVRRGLLSE